MNTTLTYVLGTVAVLAGMGIVLGLGPNAERADSFVGTTVLIMGGVIIHALALSTATICSEIRKLKK